MIQEKNILFITQWKFDDALIQTYTLPYIQIINSLKVFDNAYLIVFNSRSEISRQYSVNKLNVIELPYDNITFLSVFGICSSLKKLIDSKRITHLHPWCTTAGTLGFLLKKFHRRNLNLVIDSFEPHAEAMVENGEWRNRSLKFLILFYLEKLQVKNANALIFAAEGMETYILKKFKLKARYYYVKPACVDLNKFIPNKETGNNYRKDLGIENKIICVYAGKLGGIYLEDEVFEFIKVCCEFWKNKFVFLLLSNIGDEDLKVKCEQYDISISSVKKVFVPHQEVVNYLSMADFAICPVKPVPSKRYCSPIKNGEYWAIGLPVLITSNISTDSVIIKENNAGFVWEELDRNSYLESVNYLNDLFAKESKDQIAKRIRLIAEKHRNYKIAEKVYQQLYI